MKKTKKTILLDLDGVLNDYSNGYEQNFIPPVRKDAVTFLEKLSKKFTVKLFTARKLTLAVRWVRENQLEDYIDSVTNIKEPSWLIIDDRCIKFNGNYSQLLDDINEFEVWYKS